MPRRTMKTGYGVGTLRRRIEDLTSEVMLMGKDKRLPVEDAAAIGKSLSEALGKVNAYRTRDYRNSLEEGDR